MRLPQPKEKEIQRTILDWLRVKGAFPIRINSGAMQGDHKGKRWFLRFTSEPGCADILCCLRGAFISVEVKRPGASTAPTRKLAQESFAESVRRAGGIALVVTGIDDLERQLREAGVM